MSSSILDISLHKLNYYFLNFLSLILMFYVLINIHMRLCYDESVCVWTSKNINYIKPEKYL